MKTSRFSEQRIALILKQVDDGLGVDDVCQRVGVLQQTYYRWRKKFGGLIPSEVKRFRQLEEENRRLKEMLANLSLAKAMLQDVLSKKSFEACEGAWPDRLSSGGVSDINPACLWRAHVPEADLFYKPRLSSQAVLIQRI